MSFVSRIRSIMQKSVNANSDGYDFAKLKKWAIEHIKKQIKDNSSDDMKKSLEYGDFSVCKALSMVEEMQKAVYPVGTIREWKGRKYIKVAPGKWKPKYDSMTRGAKSSLTRILHSLEKCSNDEELYAIISQANARFRDENGKLLPEAQIIYDNHKTASRGIENGKKIDSIYEKNLKRIKELEKQGKSDDEIDNDKVIKQTKEDMKNIGKEKSNVNKKENNFSRILSDKQLINSIDRKRNKLSSPGKDVTPIEEELKNVSEKLKNMNNKELNDVFDNFETDYTKYPSIGEFEDELEERLKTFDMVYDRLSNNNKKDEESKPSEKKEHKINMNMGYSVTESELKRKIDEKKKEIKEDERKYNDYKNQKGENSKYTKTAKKNLEDDKKSLERWENWLDLMKDGDISESDTNNITEEKKDKESIRIKWAQEKMRNINLHKDYDKLADLSIDKGDEILRIERKGRSLLGYKKYEDLTSPDKATFNRYVKERSKLQEEFNEIQEKLYDTEKEIKSSDKKIMDLEEEFEDAESKDTGVNGTVTDSQTNERVISETIGDKKEPGERKREGNVETIFGNDYSKKHKLELKMNVMGPVLGKPKMDKELFDELSKYSMGSDSFTLSKKYGLRGDEFLALVNKVKENRVTIVGNDEQKKKPDFSKMTSYERFEYIRNNPVSSEERKLIQHLNDVDNAAKKLTGNETADDIQKKIDAKQKQLDKLDSVDKKDLTKINKVGWELDELKNMKEALNRKNNEVKKSYTDRVKEIKNSIDDLTRY